MTTTTSTVHILRQNEWTSNFLVFAPNPMMYLKKKKNKRIIFLEQCFHKVLPVLHTYIHTRYFNSNY